MFGCYGLVSKFDDGSFVRAIMWQLALAAFVFASVYNLFYIVIGPDWPLWVISPLIVLGAWAGMLVLSANIYDE